MKLRLMVAATVLGIVAALAGCGEQAPKTDSATAPRPVELIDLDTVLRILSETLEELDLEKIGRAAPAEIDRMAVTPPTEGRDKFILSRQLNQGEEEPFLTRFPGRLNKARVLSRQITVSLLPNGVILGFIDANNNKVKDGQEEDIFRISVDQQRGRVIASDGKNAHHRDYQYGNFLDGFFTHYLLGTMLSRQQQTGFDSSKLADVKMSAAGYHKAALQALQQQAAATPGGPPQAPAAGPAPAQQSSPGFFQSFLGHLHFPKWWRKKK